jgi:hypothetical protein
MRVRQVFLALALAIGLALLVTLLLEGGSNTAQARQGVSEASIKTPETITSGDVVVQGSGAVWAIETVDDPKTFSQMTDRSLVLDSADHPHITYGEDHLYYAWHDGTVWHHQTVDPSPSVGTYASIRVDSNDWPHICYYDATNGDLKYAHWTGSMWDVQVVDSGGDVGSHTSLALDIDDYPHISYHDNLNGDLKYAHWTGSTWVSETVDSSGDVGQYTSLALDSDVHPHVSYYECPESGDPYDTCTIKYAHWTGSTWDIQVIASGGNVPTDTSLVLDSYDRPHISYCRYFSYPLTPKPYGSLEYARWTGSAWDIQTVTSASTPNSLALDSDDRPHISYRTSYPLTDLKYARWTGSAWDIQTVDDEGYSYDCISLAIAADGYPRINYLYKDDADFRSDSLKYARWTGWVWDIQTVDDAGGVGEHASLALDSDGHPHISYYDYTNYALKYAYWTGSIWVSETVDSSGDVGGDTSLVLDSYDHPHISYYDYTNHALKYAYWTGTVWVSEIVDSAWGRYSSLALDSDGYPHISYSAGGLKYAHWTGSTWMSETVDSSENSVQYTSLALDSNGYPHISYHDDYPKNALKYARWTGSTWVSETVDSSGDVGQYTSLALDSNGYPHISYRDDYPNDTLKYAHWTGSTWVSETVDSSGDVGQYTSLALDSDGYPHISYHDGYPNNTLKYAHWTGSTWVSETVDSNGRVGAYTSLALDADSYPHIGYYAAGGDLKYARLTTFLYLDKHATPLDGLRNDGTLTYTLILSGSGLNVRLWDPLPENVLYISDSLTSTLTPPATYSTAVRAVVWEGTLAVGATYEVSFQVTPAITGAEALSLPIVNTAWVTGTHSSVGTSATVIVNAYRLYFPIIGKHH